MARLLHSIGKIYLLEYKERRRPVKNTIHFLIKKFCNATSKKEGGNNEEVFNRLYLYHRPRGVCRLGTRRLGKSERQQL
jgi:hypothetical protein